MSHKKFRVVPDSFPNNRYHIFQRNKPPEAGWITLFRPNERRDDIPSDQDVSFALNEFGNAHHGRRSMHRLREMLEYAIEVADDPQWHFDEE
jgi:hypothetical protein